MKFHCDRCKTRYSIADERVRGKILKIRCKNCEAVITVREGMDSSGGASPSANGAKTGKGKAASGKGAGGAAKRSAASSNKTSKASKSSKASRPTNPSGPRPTLEKAFKRAMSGSPQAAPMPTGGFDDDATVINEDPSAAIAEAKLAAERQAATSGSQAAPPPMPADVGFARPRTEPPTPAPGRASSESGHLPDHLEEEWYVSVDGEQEGPFSLDEAKRWVSAQAPGEELYCWSEGFDDWLPVDKVSHFRPLRPPTVDPRAPTAMASPAQQAAVPRPPAPGDGPQPLFAATAAALDSDQAASGNPFASAGLGGKSGSSLDSSAFDGAADDDDFDFDVGEASRVVQMPMLLDAMRERAPGKNGSADGGLPGMEDDSVSAGGSSGGFAQVRKVTGGMPTVVPLGDQSDVGNDSLLTPSSRRRRGVPLWTLLAAAGLIVAAGVVLLAVNMGDDGDGNLRIRRSRLDNENLGHSLEPRQRGKQPDGSAQRPVQTRTAARATRPRNKGRTPANSGGAAVSTDKRPAATPYDPFAPKDDNTSFGSDDPNKPLSPDEIMKVYRENRLGIQWCYEQALKKDPLLDIAKVYVFLTVAPSGSVTAVKLSAASATPLGQCLKTRIRRWRFRKSPEEFSSKFPLVFQN